MSELNNQASCDRDEKHSTLERRNDNIWGPIGRAYCIRGIAKLTESAGALAAHFGASQTVSELLRS